MAFWQRATPLVRVANSCCRDRLGRVQGAEVIIMGAQDLPRVEGSINAAKKPHLRSSRYQDQ